MQQGYCPSWKKQQHCWMSLRGAGTTKLSLPDAAVTCSTLNSASLAPAAAAAAAAVVLAAQPLPGSSSSSSSSAGDDALVLSVAQLWEFGHEMGHALHLVLSSRQPACHLSGRFLPPSLLEVPSQLFERLFTSPHILAQLCHHHQTAQPLPAHLAGPLASYYSRRYASPLALSARAAAGLAEHMLGQYGDEAGGCGIWRGSWQLLSELPGAAAAAGSLRELSLLPVMAASNGTYHCYLISWCIAARLAEQVFEPLLQQTSGASSTTDGSQRVAELQLAAATVMGMHAGLSRQELVCQLQTACGIPSFNAALMASRDQLLEDLALGSADQLHTDLQRWLWTPE
ncbi:hypothetical protein OEZ86_003925 [Tetradesmus obliquus]|nr:hypothetical protein OEZ86_003925 [Tetradesmus obliquus]